MVFFFFFFLWKKNYKRFSAILMPGLLIIWTINIREFLSGRAGLGPSLFGQVSLIKTLIFATQIASN
jgi:hypothetical protein